MLVSFIIPAYNASDTIVRSLVSIYRLPFEKSSFEIIVIDDCSTDNTIELVEEYARSHSNLVLLRQSEGHRQGAARNRGVAIAQGRYIIFVDSDDETSKGAVSALQLAEEMKLDMVAMRYARVGSDGNIMEEVSLRYGKNRLFTGVDLQTEFPFWSTALWSYIYRKAFLDYVNYPFAEDVLYEDSDFVNVHLFHAKRMSYCDERGYVVHYNEASVTHTLSYRHLCDYALMGTRMLRFYESLEDKTSRYAKMILKGGSYNIIKAFRKLPRLKSSSAVRSFYDRFDARYDRKQLLGNRESTCRLTPWTRFGLKHRDLCVFLLGFTFPFFKLFQK